MHFASCQYKRCSVKCTPLQSGSIVNFVIWQFLIDWFPKIRLYGKFWLYGKFRDLFPKIRLYGKFRKFLIDWFPKIPWLFPIKWIPVNGKYITWYLEKYISGK
jgi:hypothetical protein